MRYKNGQKVSVGDMVTLAGKAGKVVCSMDDGIYPPEYPEAEWSYLGRGVMIDFVSCGLVHCEEPEEDLLLVRRF